jgi:two-component system phosphate regulon response regulator PhoB
MDVNAYIHRTNARMLFTLPISERKALQWRMAQVKRQRILVVDDSELARELACYALEDAMFEVKTAASVDEAKLLLVRWMPDLMLLDVTMPRVSGVELCRQLKASLAHLVPVILFSDRPDAELSRLAEECGADGFLSKGYGPDGLARKVREIRSMILW